MATLNDLLSLVRADPVTAVAWLVLAGLSIGSGWLAWRVLRKTGATPADRLTVLSALVASAVAASGMWEFFDEKLPRLPIALRVVFFGFLELAVLTSAVRARQNIRDADGPGTAGVDGLAVWVLTGLSAVLSALAADSFAVDVLRLATPFVAAWLWERGLAGERRKRAGAQQRERVYWRLTRERILVRLGLAEPADRAISEVAAHRRVTAVARAAHRVQLTAGARIAGGWRRSRALARLRKSMNAAIEHAALATDPGQQRTLISQIGALTHAASLTSAGMPAPWTRVLASLTVDQIQPDPEVEQAKAVLDSWANLWNGPNALGSHPRQLFTDPPPAPPSLTPAADPTAPPTPGAGGHLPAPDPALPLLGDPALTPRPSHLDPGPDRVTPLTEQAALVPVIADLSQAAHDSQRIRVAIDALGTATSPGDIVAWLAAHGVTVTASNAKTVLKRYKRSSAGPTSPGRPAA
ncbi:hypothetical protein [Nonomuraea sp. NPDC050540]|uniref:hypothetical protein n=1 Tax=Nonomuraea sp. NPDC050540 TaxID=3364367 RepID=UPI0037AF8027